MDSLEQLRSEIARRRTFGIVSHPDGPGAGVASGAAVADDDGADVTGVPPATVKVNWSDTGWPSLETTLSALARLLAVVLSRRDCA